MLLPHVGMTWWLCSLAVGQFLCGPASLLLGWRPQKHPAHRAAVRMQERSPAALTVGAGPEQAPNRCQLVPLSLGPTPALGALLLLLWVGKSPHLVLTIWLFFSICPKEAPVGARKQEKEKGASCLLSHLLTDYHTVWILTGVCLPLATSVGKSHLREGAYN